MKVFKVFLSLKWYEFSAWFEEFWILICAVLWFGIWGVLGGCSGWNIFNEKSIVDNVAKGLFCGLLFVLCAGVIYGVVWCIKWFIHMIKGNWKKAKAFVAFENESTGKLCPTCKSLLAHSHRHYGGHVEYTLYCKTCKTVERKWL
jgi:hypothetical protein